MTGVLENKKILVTGASRGIGRAAALRLASEGATIAAHYGRSREAAEGTVAELAGPGHLMIQADIADADEAAALPGRVAEALGGLDVVVNNAGIYALQGIRDCATDAWLANWRQTLGVNLLGPAMVCHGAVQIMLASGGGRIINISSRGAFRGEPGAPAYGASKAGLNSLSQSLAQDLAPHGIYVFAVAPGFVATDMARELLDGPEGQSIREQSPLGRVASPEEIAHTVAFLAAEGTEYLTGGIIDANGASYLRS